VVATLAPSVIASKTPRLKRPPAGAMMLTVRNLNQSLSHLVLLNAHHQLTRPTWSVWRLPLSLRQHNSLTSNGPPTLNTESSHSASRYQMAKKLQWLHTQATTSRALKFRQTLKQLESLSSQMKNTSTTSTLPGEMAMCSIFRVSRLLTLNHTILKVVRRPWSWTAGELLALNSATRSLVI